MLCPNTPEIDHMLKKEREQDIERAIQMRLAWEALKEGEPAKQSTPWYVLVLRWLVEKIALHAAHKQAAKPALVE